MLNVRFHKNNTVRSDMRDRKIKDEKRLHTVVSSQ